MGPWSFIVAGACGIAFFLLNIPPGIPALASSPPPLAAAAFDVGRYYRTYGRRWSIFTWLGAVSVPLGLVTIVVLAALCRAGERDHVVSGDPAAPVDGWQWLVVLVLGVATGLAGSAFGAYFGGLALSGGNWPEGASKAISDVANVAVCCYLSTQAMFMAAAGATLVEFRYLPGGFDAASYVLAALSLVIAAVSFVGSLGLFVRAASMSAGAPVTWLGFGGLMVWMLLLGVYLLYRGLAG